MSESLAYSPYSRIELISMFEARESISLIMPGGHPLITWGGMLCSCSTIAGAASSSPAFASSCSMSGSALPLFFFEPPYMKLPTITCANAKPMRARQTHSTRHETYGDTHKTKVTMLLFLFSWDSKQTTWQNNYDSIKFTQKFRWFIWHRKKQKSPELFQLPSGLHLHCHQ